MFHPSLGRLPHRWRLALAARRGANATRAITATTFSSDSTTTTRPRWPISAGAAHLSAGTWQSFRCFSQTAAWQEEKSEEEQEAKNEAELESDETLKQLLDIHAPELTYRGSESTTYRALYKALRAEELKKYGTLEDMSIKSPFDTGKRKATGDGILFEDPEEKAARLKRKQEYKKGLKQARKKAKAEPVVRPEPIPFGPFEDFIQPIALTLWGGKMEETQHRPRLRFTAQFLGPTCLWRVQIRISMNASENEIWGKIWRASRDKVKSGNAKRSGGEDAMKAPPPLEAVVQDVFRRRLARVAVEKPSMQLGLETRLQYEAERGLSNPLQVSYYHNTDPHISRIPGRARQHMRHFDICGPSSDWGTEIRHDDHIWTGKGGNVLSNSFETEKIAVGSFGANIQIWVWKADYDLREMEAFMNPNLRPALELQKVKEEEAVRFQTGRAPLPRKSRRTIMNELQAQKQLATKSKALRLSDGGWKKILQVVERGTQTMVDGKLVSKHQVLVDDLKGFVSFPPGCTHPTRAEMESVWGPRLAARQSADALANYEAFIHSQMARGVVPATVDPVTFVQGQVMLGYMNNPTRKEARKAHDKLKEELKQIEKHMEIGRSGVTVIDDGDDGDYGDYGDYGDNDNRDLFTDALPTEEDVSEGRNQQSHQRAKGEMRQTTQRIANKPKKWTQ